MRIEELTALYSPLDIEYSQAMSGPYEDLSFRTDEITIIAGLKGGRISGFWRPVVAVGDDKLQKLHIERLYDICRNIYYMDFLIDGKLSVISQFLLRQGYAARPYYTQIIDLTKTEEELHADLRKSYKSLINKNHVSSSYNSHEAAMELVRRIHSHCSQERPNKSITWHIQTNMLRQEQAFLVVGEANSYVFICHNNCSAYYFSGRSMDGNTHSYIWAAIIRAKRISCKTFEMGGQVFSGYSKLTNISKFKRGFGGETKTRLILEKEK
jgi:hypothetical protein